jgi:hypothetical protein
MLPNICTLICGREIRGKFGIHIKPLRHSLLSAIALSLAFCVPAAMAVQYQIVYVPVTVIINGKPVVIRRPVVRPVAAAQKFTLTVNVSGNGSVASTPAGIACGTDCTEAYASGTAVQLTATASNDATFSGWSADCAGTATICIVTMSQARSVTATFIVPPPPTSGAPIIGGCPIFPDKTIFNTRIDDHARFPVHPQSATWINNIGATRRFHADWGTTENQASVSYYGIPYNVVDGTAATTSWPTVSFPNGYPDESDCAVAQSGGFGIRQNCTTLSAAQQRFPFPNDPIIKLEGGTCNDPNSCGDRHALIVEQGSCRLWESWLSYKMNGAWTSGSTAAWDLRSFAMRPDGWTSGDAAGLPILPLIVRASEADADDIRHALRVTFRDSVLNNTHVWPARHHAGNATAGGIPFGAILRLRSDFVIPMNWTTQAKALAHAMQRYGLYVADIGSDLFVQAEPSAQWSDATITQVQTLQMSQFEFVDTSAVTSDARFNNNSFQGAW